MAPGGVLLLDKNWNVAGSGYGFLTGEEKELIFLQAYAQVHKGKACWLDRWRAVTWGCGPEGTDERFRGGRLQGPLVKRVKRVKQQVDVSS